MIYRDQIEYPTDFGQICKKIIEAPDMKENSLKTVLGYVFCDKNNYRDRIREQQWTNERGLPLILQTFDQWKKRVITYHLFWTDESGRIRPLRSQSMGKAIIVIKQIVCRSYSQQCGDGGSSDGWATVELWISKELKLWINNQQNIPGKIFEWSR